MQNTLDMAISCYYGTEDFKATVSHPYWVNSTHRSIIKCINELITTSNVQLITGMKWNISSGKTGRENLRPNNSWHKYFSPILLNMVKANTIFNLNRLSFITNKHKQLLFPFFYITKSHSSIVFHSILLTDMHCKVLTRYIQNSPTFDESRRFLIANDR